MRQNKLGPVHAHQIVVKPKSKRAGTFANPVKPGQATGARDSTQTRPEFKSSRDNPQDAARPGSNDHRNHKSLESRGGPQAVYHQGHE